MSYQVIARKWRPANFESIVGQTHITQTLLNALKNNRLHHALLFTGPRGTGKTSTARVLAKALRCPDDPKGESQEAQDISAGRSVDVIEIDGASNNGVDAIRELRETVGYMPSSGSHKVYIIDEVHMLSTAAFNALLKTLEEPPPHVIFIMATTEAHKIPATILSRCQRFDFRRIPLKLITDHLEYICKSDGVEADREALWMIARQGDGSMRDSQSLLDQVITFCGQKISQLDVISVLGLTDRQLLVEMLSALLKRDPQLTLSCISKVFRAGYDPKLFVRDLLEEIRHALMVKVTVERAQEFVDLPQSELEHLKQLTQDLSEEDLHLLFDMALKGAADVSKSSDPQIVFEMLLLRMAAAPRLLSLKNLGLLHTTSESRPLSSTPPPLQTSSVTPASVNVVQQNSTPQTQAEPLAMTPNTESVANTAPLEERWLAFVQKVKSVNAVIGANLDHFQIESVENKILSVHLSEKMKFMSEKVTQPEFLKKVTNYLSMYWEPGMQIRIQKIADSQSSGLSAKALNEKKEQEKWDALRKQVEAHPLIRASKEILKTEIKSIKEIKQ